MKKKTPWRDPIVEEADAITIGGGFAALLVAGRLREKGLAKIRIIEKGEHLNIYNIGTEDEVTIEGLAKEIGSYFGREVQVMPGSLQPGSTVRRCPNIAKVSALGYRPRVSLNNRPPCLSPSPRSL